MDKRELWWKHIPGPQRFLSDLVGKTTKGGAILLCVDDLSDCFWEYYADELSMIDSNYSIAHIDAPQALAEIGSFLLRTYCGNIEYDPLAKSVACFLAAPGRLENKVIVVKDVVPTKEWQTFLVDYGKTASSSSGTLVFPYSSRTPIACKYKGVWDARVADYVQLYDMQLFSSMLCDRGGSAQANLQAYEAQLAARFSQIDMELCVALLEQDVKRDPQTALRELSGRFPACAALCENPTRIHDIIWEAQIQVVFPFLEQERRRIIIKYEKVLRRFLPMQDDYGTEISQPQDLEYRHMVYLERDLSPEMDSEDWARLSQYHKSRNRLAHLKILAWSEVQELLS
jgi:hypothetical protein